MISTLGILTILVKILLAVSILGLTLALTMYFKEILLKSIKNTQNNLDKGTDLVVKGKKEENRICPVCNSKQNNEWSCCLICGNDHSSSQTIEIKDQDCINSTESVVVIDASEGSANENIQILEYSESDLENKAPEEENKGILDLSIEELQPEDNICGKKENITFDINQENINNARLQFKEKEEDLGEPIIKDEKKEALELPTKDVYSKNGRNKSKGRNKGSKNQ